MNNEFSTDIITDGDIAALDIGYELSTKRKLLNLTERQIATQLKLPVEQVMALESNQFDYFRSKTFARGYLKNYVRLLQLEESQILTSFDEQQEERKPVLQPVDKVNKQAHLTDPIVLFVSIVLVSVLVFFVFWWPTLESKAPPVEAMADVSEAAEEVTSDSSQLDADESATLTNLNSIESLTDVQSTPSDSAAKFKQTTLDTEDADVVTGLSAETLALLEEAGVSTDKVSQATQDMVAKKTAENLAEATASTTKASDVSVNYTDDIVMQFIRDCWTEVRDSNGKILYSGVKTANSQLTLSGSESYRVVLGYAPGVSELTFKGKRFDFTSFIRKDLARFELK